MFQLREKNRARRRERKNGDGEEKDGMEKACTWMLLIHLLVHPPANLTSSLRAYFRRKEKTVASSWSFKCSRRSGFERRDRPLGSLRWRRVLFWVSTQTRDRDPIAFVCWYTSQCHLKTNMTSSGSSITLAHHGEARRDAGRSSDYPLGSTWLSAQPATTAASDCVAALPCAFHISYLTAASPL